MIFNNFFRRYRFSDIELKHLLLGTVLFTAVMVSLFFDSNIPILEVVLIVILTAPLFFLHEIGHKVNAQKFNLWAEFRIDTNGALITALSIFLPFKLVAPGAVMIRANDYSEVPAMGKVAGYGPAVNILLGGLYLIVTGICFLAEFWLGMNVEIFLASFFYASSFSFFLGIFNMLPFGPLDGKKVKFWNDTVFWLLFGISGLLVVETYVSAFILGSQYLFLLGSVVITFNPNIGLFYPLILGIVTFLVGYYLIKKLSDPNWEPGKQTSQDVDYRQYYYKQEPVLQKGQNRPHSSSAPMNTPCTECGKRDLLPFRCTSCNKIFCAEHRLPGKHFCVVDYEYRK